VRTSHRHPTPHRADEAPPAVEAAVAQIDAEGTIVAWSAGAERLFGHAPHEAIGAPSSLLAPEGTGRSAVVDRALRGEPVPREETLRRARDGRLVPVSISAHPLLGADGRVIGATAVFVDLSDAPTGASTDSLLRLLLDTAQEAFVAMDARGRIRDWNPAAEVLFGWSRAEVLGRPVVDTIVPERLRDAHRRSLRRYLDGEPTRMVGNRLEVAALCRDGREIPVEVTVAPLRVGEGWMFTAFLRDITERTLAREALERSHLELAKAQHVARMGHWDWDAATDRVTWSPALHDVTGIPRGEELSGTRLLGHVHADDRPVVRRHLAALLRDDAPLDVDLRCVRPDGAVLVLHCRASVLRRTGGAVRRVTGTIVDVTERALAEAASRRSAAVVASTEDAVVTEDRHGRITSWNPGAERMFGHSAEEAVGRTMAIIVPAPVAGEEAVLLGRVLQGERLQHIETQRCTADGDLIDVSLTVSPVLDDDGHIAEISCIARDISDRKAAERELRRYTEDLAALARQDPLTGLLTERELHGALDAELPRSRRSGHPCSLVVLDVDGLARVNEDRGRRAGDLVLSELGAVVHQACTEGMVACRLAGDEVAIVVPGAGAGQAMALAQRITAAWDAGDRATGISTGVATWPDEAADKAALIGRARAALRFGRRPDTPDGDPTVVHALRQSGQADTTDRVVALLRRHLRMEIAYLSEFVGDDQVIRQVDAGPEHPELRRGAEVPLEAGYCRRMVEAELPGVIADTAADPVASALAVTREARIGSYVGVPVRFGDGRLYGSLCCASRHPNPRLDETATHFAHVCARLIGDLLDQRELEEENRRLHGELTGVRALLAALDARDHYTGEHSEAVVQLAGAVAERLGLSSSHVAEVEQVALLHDIGKIGIADSILQKPGALSDDEWRAMHEHPAIGARIIGSIPSLAHLAPAVRAEHERWDGGGYPDGLAGRAIPLASRIILACDAYHAMTSDRPYRAAMAHDAAWGELARCSGTQFDPDVVVALRTALDRGGSVTRRAGGDAAPDEQPLTLMVVEDDPALRLALEHGLAAEGLEVETVADAESAYRLAVERRPDAILLDWILVGGEGGPTACRKLRALHPDAPILMHTGLSDLRDRQLARDAGAHAFVEKGTPLPRIAEEIRSAVADRAGHR